MEIKNQSDINLLKNYTLAINCRATHKHMIQWATHNETSCRATWEANQEANWEVD